MHYPDTSLLIAAMTIEAGSAAAQVWIEVHRGSLLISEWTVVEISAALAMKVRLGVLTPERRAMTKAVFDRLTAGSLTVVPVASVDYRLASRFADVVESHLRGGDALHLAIAARHSATVCTFDRQQASAGPIVGVPTQLIA